MRVWRLCRRAHAAPDGEGARRYGGRWNQRGTALVYTSASASLAALEYLVHLDPEDAPPDLILVPADIAPAVVIRELRIAELPADWRSLPASDALARMGTSWARRLESAVLSVPSAVVPEERNYLLNPAHPQFREIAFGPARPFAFDPRLWKTRPRRRTRSSSR
jgi:RES domain-containing protein